MASVPNQRKVVMPPHGERIRDTEHIYGMFSIEAAPDVIRNCGYGGFCLYMYFQKNQDGYSWDLSPAAIEKEWGMKPDAYRSAFSKLVEYGYLVPKDEGSNIYFFHEFPRVGKNPTRENEQDFSVLGKTPYAYKEKPNTRVGKNPTPYRENPQRNNTDNTIINKNKGIASLRSALPAASGGEIWKQKIDELVSKLDSTDNKTKRNMMIDDFYYEVDASYEFQANPQLKQGLIAKCGELINTYCR